MAKQVHSYRMLSLISRISSGTSKNSSRLLIGIMQSVNLVYQLFVDMAMLVHQQGEMLDNIELSLNSASSYVKKSEKKLKEAKEDHQSARKVSSLINSRKCAVSCSLDLSSSL